MVEIYFHLFFILWSEMMVFVVDEASCGDGGKGSAEKAGREGSKRREKKLILSLHSKTSRISRKVLTYEAQLPANQRSKRFT